jgi:hypothetical protein
MQVTSRAKRSEVIHAILFRDEPSVAPGSVVITILESMGGMPYRDLPALGDMVVQLRSTSLLAHKAGVAVALVCRVTGCFVDGGNGE